MSYRVQINQAVRGAWIAKRLFDVWNVADGEPMRAAYMVTVTTEELRTKTWWETNFGKDIVGEIWVNSLNASGVWSLEKFKSGQIHAHAVMVVKMEDVEKFKLPLNNWAGHMDGVPKEGYVHCVNVSNLVAASAYVTKPEPALAGEEVGELLDGPQYVGDAFSTQEQLDAPLFTLLSE